jgi:hypothetical protein
MLITLDLVLPVDISKSGTGKQGFQQFQEETTRLSSSTFGESLVYRQLRLASRFLLHFTLEDADRFFSDPLSSQLLSGKPSYLSARVKSSIISNDSS